MAGDDLAYPDNVINSSQQTDVHGSFMEEIVKENGELR